MQFPVEVERLRLPLGVANAIPQAPDLFHPRGSRRDVSRVSNKPAVKLAMKRKVGLVARAPADRVGEPRHRAGIGARQAGHHLVDQRPRRARFGRKADERLTNRSLGAFGGRRDRRMTGFARRGSEAGHGAHDLIFVKRLQPQLPAA